MRSTSIGFSPASTVNQPGGAAGSAVAGGEPGQRKSQVHVTCLLLWRCDRAAAVRRVLGFRLLLLDGAHHLDLRAPANSIGMASPQAIDLVGPSTPWPIWMSAGRAIDGEVPPQRSLLQAAADEASDQPAACADRLLVDRDRVANPPARSPSS